MLLVLRSLRPFQLISSVRIVNEVRCVVTREGLSNAVFDFPERLEEKLKAIREKLQLSPDEFGRRVGAQNGAEIVSYESARLRVSLLTVNRR